MPKTGRKFLLGQKSTQLNFILNQGEDCQEEEFQDLVILAKSTKFLLPEWNFYYINLDKINLLLIPSQGQPCRPKLKVTGF